MKAPEGPTTPPTTESAAAAIAAECDAIKAMLLAKNAAYGNSALDPVRVFSRASTHEQIRVRIDDKLSRLQRGSVFGDEDTVLDLIGYLVLLRIAVRAGAPPIGEEPTKEPTKESTEEQTGPSAQAPKPDAAQAKGRVHAVDRVTGFRKAPFSHKPLKAQRDEAWVKAAAGVRGRCHGLTFTVWNQRSKNTGNNTPGHVLAWYRGEPPEEHRYDCASCGRASERYGFDAQFHHHECEVFAGKSEEGSAAK